MNLNEIKLNVRCIKSWDEISHDFHLFSCEEIFHRLNFNVGKEDFLKVHCSICNQVYGFPYLQCLFSVIVFFNMSPHRSQGCQRTLLRIEMTEFIEISRCETRSNKFWKWSGIGNFSAPIQFMGVLDFQMGASLSQLKRKNLWWWFLFWKSFFVQCLFMRTFGGYLFVWGQFCVFLSSGSITRRGGLVSKWWFSHTSTFKCPPVYFLIF